MQFFCQYSDSIDLTINPNISQKTAMCMFGITTIYNYEEKIAKIIQIVEEFFILTKTDLSLYEYYKFMPFATLKQCGL